MEIEYIDEIHTYLVDGVITPSVSEILRFIFPNKYANIPKYILEKKAQFGTRIHNAIDKYEQGIDFELTELEDVTFQQYLRVKVENNIQVLSQEEIVAYEEKYCGRLDMIANINGTRSLVDIKTTAKLDTESLEWQLGMYQLAYGEVFDKCYCLWLPKKDLGRLVEIDPKSKEEILKVLEEYEVSKNE